MIRIIILFFIKLGFVIYGIYKLLNSIFDLYHVNRLFSDIHEEALESLRANQKENILAFFSLIFSISGFILNILGYLLFELSKVLKVVFKVLKYEFGHFQARIKLISKKLIFILYFLPVLLTILSLFIWWDEPWSIAFKRVTPELWIVLMYICYSFFIAIIFFIILHDGAKNNIINQGFTAWFGVAKPRKSDHWFLRFCYWMHPETYVIGRACGFHVIYILLVYGSYYSLLGLYTFKGVFF
jgi:hypothetical protein